MNNIKVGWMYFWNIIRESMRDVLAKTIRIVFGTSWNEKIWEISNNNLATAWIYRIGAYLVPEENEISQEYSPFFKFIWAKLEYEFAKSDQLKNKMVNPLKQSLVIIFLRIKLSKLLIFPRINSKLLEK